MRNRFDDVVTLPTDDRVVGDPTGRLRRGPPLGRAKTCAISFVTRGYDVDTPWRKLHKKDRDWILFTDEQPTAPIFAGFDASEVRGALKRAEEPSYQGTFTGARKYVLQTFATTQRDMMKRRVAQFMTSSDCPVCHGQRLRPEALLVKFAGLNISDISRLPQNGNKTSSTTSFRPRLA
jgi:excinuclease UvrABC ATPase subunit